MAKNLNKPRYLKGLPLISFNPKQYRACSPALLSPQIKRKPQVTRERAASLFIEGLDVIQLDLEVNGNTNAEQVCDTAVDGVPQKDNEQLQLTSEDDAKAVELDSEMPFPGEPTETMPSEKISGALAKENNHEDSTKLPISEEFGVQTEYNKVSSEKEQSTIYKNIKVSAGIVQQKENEQPMAIKEAKEELAVTQNEFYVRKENAQKRKMTMELDVGCRTKQHEDVQAERADALRKENFERWDGNSAASSVASDAACESGNLEGARPRGFLSWINSITFGFFRKKNSAKQ